jgi:hypothetical protein
MDATTVSTAQGGEWVQLMTVAFYAWVASQPCCCHQCCCSCCWLSLALLLQIWSHREHFSSRSRRQGQCNQTWHGVDQGWVHTASDFCCRCPCCCVFCCRTDAPTVGTFTAGQGGRVNATRGGTVLIKDGVRVSPFWWCCCCCCCLCIVAVHRCPYRRHVHGRPGRQSQRNQGWHCFDQGWGEGGGRTRQLQRKCQRDHL